METIQSVFYCFLSIYNFINAIKIGFFRLSYLSELPPLDRGRISSE